MTPGQHLVLARLAGRFRPRWRQSFSRATSTRPHGITVVIPSRNGKDLLAAQLPGILRELRGFAYEVQIVDNGSTDGTASFLAAEFPETHAAVFRDPLSFARAVNRGIEVARYSHVCLLNNDMLLDPGFFRALAEAFDRVPNLFCATAQIRFPPGVRREETGKAVMAQDRPEDFPLRCDEPLGGEDLTWVLYGSGGCSLYDTAKLQALGKIDEAYEPAYVEDLDIGYRAWQRGWPSVYVARAVVEHRHRATTSRYYSEEQLEEVLEVNYLKFLARAVASPELFRRLWEQALERLMLRADRPAAIAALHHASQIAVEGGPLIEPAIAEEEFLALTNGRVAIFPGSGEGTEIVAVEHLHTPPPAQLERHARIIQVRSTADSPEFRAATAMSKR